MVTVYRNEIEGFIDSHRGEMIEDICTLYRTNSEKMPYVKDKPYEEGPFQALQAALGMTEGYDFSIHNYDNYVGTAGLNGKERQLDILAHLDVIPAGEGWTEAKPLEPAVKDRKLFRRGIADDKGPVMVASYAMRAVEELGIPLNKDARLILGTDEECGSSDVVDYYDKEDETSIASSPDAEFPVINIEKGHLEGHFHTSFQVSEAMPRLVEVEAGIKTDVVPGKAGAIVEGINFKALEAAAETVERETGVSFVLKGDLPVMTVTVQGEGVHVSTPQEGENALAGLLVYLTRLPFAECPQMDMVKSLPKFLLHGDTYGKAAGISMENELPDALTLAPSMLIVGADGLEGIFDNRCPIYVIEESMLGVVEQAMADQGLTLKDDPVMPPHYMNGNSYLVRTLLSVYEDYTGLEGSCQITGGSTYVHSLENGITYDTALPGTGNRIHGADEFTMVDESVLSTKIFAQVAMELCS